MAPNPFEISNSPRIFLFQLNILLNRALKSLRTPPLMVFEHLSTKPFEEESFKLKEIPSSQMNYKPLCTASF
jgi:hypothetical protein